MTDCENLCIANIAAGRTPTKRGPRLIQEDAGWGEEPRTPQADEVNVIVNFSTVCKSDKRNDICRQGRNQLERQMPYYLLFLISIDVSTNVTRQSVGMITRLVLFLGHVTMLSIAYAKGYFPFFLNKKSIFTIV